MYRETAQKLLEKLRKFNYNIIPDFGVDAETEELINAISNECKSTVMHRTNTNTYYMQKYESVMTKKLVNDIVRQLIINGNCISKEVMNNAIFTDNMFVGIDTDVILYKGIDSETGKSIATVGNVYVDERNLNGNVHEEIKALYKKYAREIIFKDNSKRKEERSIPKQNPFTIFKERLTHKRFTERDFKAEYTNILRKYSGYQNQEFLEKSAEYKAKYIFSKQFEQKILNTIKSGNAIEVLDDKKSEYDKLLEQVTAEIAEESNFIPNLNEIFKDIEQIYSDVETQLEAYSTDLRGISPKQIEEKIKNINSFSLKKEKKQYLGGNGYRNVNVGLGAKDDKMKFLEHEYVEKAMQNLSQEIYNLINSSENISDQHYLKKASDLTYRFIRIHPFPDSNGRTSRAIINMMTLNRNMLVTFLKEDKNIYNHCMELTSRKIGYRDDNGYLKSLYSDPDKANELEKNNASDIYNYISRNASIHKKISEVETRELKKTIDLKSL